MPPAQSNWPRRLRTLLLLGRVSNLPTVWSNCLAGWLLAGGGEWSRFLALIFGASALYVGGMYLNDAFDVEFDRRHRRERPIPSGAISPNEVWAWSGIWMVAGTLTLGSLGSSTFALTLLLTGCILVYDALHKMITFSPVLMAGCRFFLFVTAASCGEEGVTGFSVWCAIALAAYIIGLSYIARKESAEGALRFWPAYFLAAPILVSFVVNTGEYRVKALVLSIILALWVLRCVRHTFWEEQKNVGRTVSGLLAGIVLVDLLALAGGTPFIGAVFILLFVSALAFQRFVPAT